MSTTIHDPSVTEDPNARPRTARTRQSDLGGLPGAGESRIYRGASVEELIPKIEADLGNDAIVLRRRSGLTGGVGGFFQRQFVEIEACASHPHVDVYDEPDVTPVASEGLLERSPAGAPRREDPPGAMAFSPAAPESSFTEYPPGAVPWPGPPPAHAVAGQPNGALREALSPEPSFTAAQQRAYAKHYGSPPREEVAVNAPAYVQPAEATDGFQPFPEVEPEQRQGRSIRSLLSAAAPAREAPLEESPLPKAEDLQREPITMPGAESFAAALAEAEAAVPGEPVEEQLLAVGIGEPLVKDLIETAATIALPLMNPNASLKDAVRLVVQLMIPMGRRLPSKDVAVALVGPGGSGKSACARELVIKGSESGGAKVACARITGDVRSGQHLLTLEPQISKPMPVTDPDVQELLKATRREGLLLLDTPAVSPADRRSVFSLAALLDMLSADLIMMTMPATLGAKPAAQMLRALRALGASALTITHADETDQLGVAVQAACAFGLAPEYLLTSRTGDERLIPIDPTSLVEHLLP